MPATSTRAVSTRFSAAPGAQALTAAEFSGGRDTVKRTLERLGFVVTERAAVPPISDLEVGRTYSWEELGQAFGFNPSRFQVAGGMLPVPLHDALFDMVDYEKATAFIEPGTVEVAPLAFMRGRTLNDAFVILDEAQNTTEEQMKMFLTRLGLNSRAVSTGDLTQIDLRTPEQSGLVRIQSILGHVPDIKFVNS